MSTRNERVARVRRLTNDHNARVGGFAPAGTSKDVPQYRRAPKAKRALVTRGEATVIPERVGVMAFTKKTAVK